MSYINSPPFLIITEFNYPERKERREAANIVQQMWQLAVGSRTRNWSQQRLRVWGEGADRRKYIKREENGRVNKKLDRS
jgi:hypothetical protein